ncbi:MAG: hypothetical protein HC877_22880 [Thioploca sp.]|nr:hypothetical protein [Thioploca sp.]
MKTKSQHLDELREILTIDKYKSHLKYLSKEDQDEIKNYISLSLKLFTKLKADKFHKLESRYPNLNTDKDINLNKYLDRDERKILNILKTGLADNEICKLNNVDIGLRFKLLAYLTYSESILFLFEEIIKIKSNKNLNYLVLSKLQTEIIDDESYKDFKILFSRLNENLRNAIGHSDYNISEKGIEYFYYNRNTKKNESDFISLNEFQINLLKLSLLFDILLIQIDKPFLKEIEKLYSENK